VERANVEKKATEKENQFAYRITGASAAAVQVEIDQLMNARDTAYATFSFPIRDGERFVSVGTVLSYEIEEKL
jgi:hypothetical protein